MNVLYRGLQNPVSISVPGFIESDLVPSVTNGTLTKGTNSYFITPGSASECTISCTATLPDGSRRNVGNILFRVKDVPNPVASFNGKGPSDSKISKAEVLSAQGVRANLKDFVFEGVSFTVTSYDLVTKTRGQTQVLSANSAGLTEDMKTLLKNPRSGQKIYIQNIKAKGPEGSNRPLHGINLEIR